MPGSRPHVPSGPPVRPHCAGSRHHPQVGPFIVDTAAATRRPITARTTCTSLHLEPPFGVVDDARPVADGGRFGIPADGGPETRGMRRPPTPPVRLLLSGYLGRCEATADRARLDQRQLGRLVVHAGLLRWFRSDRSSGVASCQVPSWWQTSGPDASALPSVFRTRPPSRQRGHWYPGTGNGLDGVMRPGAATPSGWSRSQAFRRILHAWHGRSTSSGCRPQYQGGVGSGSTSTAPPSMPGVVVSVASSASAPSGSGVGGAAVAAAVASGFAIRWDVGGGSSLDGSSSGVGDASRARAPPSLEPSLEPFRLPPRDGATTFESGASTSGSGASTSSALAPSWLAQPPSFACAVLGGASTNSSKMFGRITPCDL